MRWGGLLVAAFGFVPNLAGGESASALESARRVGKAHYENDEFPAAVECFQRAVALAPASAADQFNVGLALMRAGDFTNALTALDRAEALDPELPAVAYLRGIIHKRRGDFSEAIGCLRRVLAQDPGCVGASYNLAVCCKALDRHAQAIEALQNALATEPRNPHCHYQLITLYRRTGDVEQAARHAETYERLKDTVDAADKTVEALERSKYSYLIELPPTGPELPADPGSGVRWVEATASAGLAPPVPPASLPAVPALPLRPAEGDLPELTMRFAVWAGGAVALGDYDGDGDLDLYVVNCSSSPAASANRLYRNDGQGRFSDVTDAARVGDRGLGMHAVFGDYDNDRRLDLYVVNAGPNVLYRNRGDGTFEDVSAAARVNEPQFGSRAAFVDYDHDNDVDLVVANTVDLAGALRGEPGLPATGLPGALNTLLRNNGNGTFTDQTDEAGLLVEAVQTRDLAFADFDGDHDVDLFLANFDGSSALFLNARLGRFASGGSFQPPLTPGAMAVAEADFNRDGHPDLVVAATAHLWLYTNAGPARFALAADLAALGSPRPARLFPAGAVVRSCDYNRDGWTDLCLTDGAGLGLLAGTGKGQFRDVSRQTGIAEVAGPIADFVLGDLDGDGDEDLVVQTRDRGPRLYWNEGGPASHWVQVRPVGRKVNRLAVGAVVEVAAPGYYQRQTARGGPLHFGLGSLTNVEVVRVTWPNGVAQNVIQPAPDRELVVEEQVKVSASCAFLWANAGHGFQLVNEVLGVGPLGVPCAPDRWFPVDCTELTRIGPDQLVPTGGEYELRLTEDLREIAFVDQVHLRVIDHPADCEVVPNEMFTGPPFPEDRFFAVREPHLPRAAFDDRGQDVLELIREHDGRCPAFERTSYDGLARPHSLTLEFGDIGEAKQPMLYLDAWIYWPDSSVSWGIFQNPDYAITPLRLEVRDAGGEWRTAIESVGLPTSKGSVVPVDLTGRFTGTHLSLRLSTTLCVYFDRVFVASRNAADRCKTTVLPVRTADLHFRGFSSMRRDALGYERFEYSPVSPTGPWSPPRGRFTRYGGVTELLGCPDDRYVIVAPGDELTLRFDATRLPAPPPGWTRSFLFYANGWVKDGDLNTKHSETVEPLPFHAMSRYPYPPDEHYPDDPAHREYLEKYQTRPSRPTIGDLPNLGQ